MERDNVPEITYALEDCPTPVEVIRVFVASGLPHALDDPAKMARLIETADVIVCAREDGRLVGFARALTDFLYTCYLSDLVVDAACQGKGVGAELVRRVRCAAGEGVRFHLFAAPGAVTFYERLGMKRVDDAWEWPAA